jgi:hypothetical protein
MNMGMQMQHKFSIYSLSPESLLIVMKIGRSSGLPHILAPSRFLRQWFVALHVFYFSAERLYSYGDSSRFSRDSLLIPTQESETIFLRRR